MKLKFNFGFIAAETQWARYLTNSESPNKNVKYLDLLDDANKEDDFNFFVGKDRIDLEFKKLCK